MQLRLRNILLLIAALAAWPAAAGGQSAAEEAFKRTLRDSIDQTVDPRKMIAFGVAMLGLILAAVVYNHWRQRPRARGPRTLNSPTKLIREISKGVNLRPAEVKQLKTLGEQQNLSNPLVLLLCPSILGKAVKENQKRLDRGVLAGLAKKIAGK